MPFDPGSFDLFDPMSVNQDPMALLRERVLGSLEPHEMTSGASWYAECLRALQNRFDSSRYISTPSPFWSSMKDIWLLSPQTNFFFK